MNFFPYVQSVTDILDYIQNYENVFSTWLWTIPIQENVLASTEVIERVNSSLPTAVKHISLWSADSSPFLSDHFFCAKMAALFAVLSF